MMPRAVCLLSLVALTLASCATRKPANPDGQPAAAASPTPAASPSPTATPSARATPTPSPTPQTRYVARVKVEGGETVEQEVSPRATPTPSPTRAATPEATPAASPSPTPKPAGNFFSRAWQRVFPPRAQPSPTPAAGAEPAATPAPPTTPKEGFFSRLWHMVFPRKENPPVALPPQWIGTIRMVDGGEGYVLIDSTTNYALSPGQTLNAVGNDFESGVVRVTAERNPPFFLADIVSGRPKTGDRVYSPTPTAPAN